MSSTLFIPYTTNSNYTKSDDTKIEANGNATLILADNPSQDFSQPFTADTGFTYNSTVTEFTGGLVRTKDRVPADVVAYASYTSSADFNYSTGDLDGTLVLDAVVEDGLLNLAHSNLSYATYDGTPVISADPTKGTIRMQIVAQYTGSPAGARGYYLEGDASANNNKINIYHNAGGLLVCELFNSGGGLGDNPYTTWSPTAGETYDLEFNWNSVTGLHNIFIDGDLKVSKTVTYTRDDTYLNNIIIGNTQYGADTKVLNFARYDTVQHTSNFTPSDWSEFGETMYVSDKIDCPVFTYVGANGLQSFDGFTVTEVGSPRYLLDGNYWNGSAWVISDGTYTQASSSTDINSNISSYTPSDTIIPSIVTESGNTLMSVDQLNIEYTGKIYPTTTPYIEYNESSYMSTLETITEGSTVTGSDLVKHVVLVNGTAKYWDGAAWSNSSGYAQSNTAAEINTNASSLISTRSSIKIRTFLYSDDGTTTPLVNYLTLTYDAALPDPTNLPTLVDINGFIYDMNGPCASEEVKARPYLKGTQNPNDGVGGGVFQKYAYETIATTDSNGFFSGSIYLQPTDEYIEFKIGRQSYYTQLTDQDSIDFNKLTLTLVE